MGVCKCGKKVVGSRTQCRRCEALNELGLNKSANEASIKAAYRDQIKAWHPDKHGKETVGLLIAEDRAKRINLAYKYLSTPPKKGGAQTTRQSSATPEPPPRQSSARSESSKGQAAGTAKSPQRTGVKEQQPITGSKTQTNGSRRKQQAIPSYPQRDFIQWNSALSKAPITRTKAAEGLKKWISSEAARRTSTVAFVIETCRRIGVEPDLAKFAKPEDARVDVLRNLWRGTVPNVKERTLAIESDKQFTERMDKMRASVVSFSHAIQLRNAKLPTQDGGFHVSLDYVLNCCHLLSASLATASTLVKREYIQPIKLVDCCIGLVWELQETHGLSQAECHAVIRCALLAHGCTDEQVAPFGAGSVDRGTIRAKKEALAKKIIDSANVIGQVIQKVKPHNRGSYATMKKSSV